MLAPRMSNLESVEHLPATASGDRKWSRRPWNFLGGKTSDGDFFAVKFVCTLTRMSCRILWVPRGSAFWSRVGGNRRLVEFFPEYRLPIAAADPRYRDREHPRPKDRANSASGSP